MKKSNFSIIYFLSTFFVLYYGFYVYIGLSTPGGKIYFPFLYHYLNIPYWLSIIVVKTSLLLLKIMGYNVYQKSLENITIEGSSGANVTWGCLGAGIMILWISFIKAHEAPFVYKLKWVIAGVIIIFLFNAMRIVFILLSFYYHWRYSQAFNAHTTFNSITYVIILILMFFFVHNYNRIQSKHVKVGSA